MAKGAKIGVESRLGTLKSWFSALPSQRKKRAAEDKAKAELKRK